MKLEKNNQNIYYVALFKEKFSLKNMFFFSLPLYLKLNKAIPLVNFKISMIKHFNYFTRVRENYAQIFTPKNFTEGTQ